MREIELTDKEAYHLLKILSKNSEATEKGSGIRWDSESASEIDAIKEKVELQIQ